MESAQNKKENIHAKHRERVREKFLKVGLDGFSEHEILEFLLFYVFAQQDTNDLAHRLINTFGSLHGVLSADVSDLCTVKGIGERAAVFLKLIGDVATRDREKPDERPILNTSDKIGQYFLRFYKTNITEMAVIAALDSRFRVIKIIKIAEGDVDNIQIPVTKITRTLVTCGASAAVLAHNHPSQVGMPSVTDIRTTERLAATLGSVGIKLLDHIIVDGKNDYISFYDSHGKIYVRK